MDLKTIREDFHITRSELAERLGINVRTLDNYEKKGKIPRYMQKLIRYEFYYGEKGPDEQLVKLKQENGYFRRLVMLYEERIRFLESQLDEN